MQSANLHQQNISVVQHNWGVTDNIKTTAAWFLSVIFISIAATYLFTSLCLLFPESVLKYFFVLFFLLGSMSHIFIFPKWLPHLYNTGGFVYMLLLSSFISITAFIVFIITSFSGDMLPFAVGAAFMLPYAIHLCWQYFAAINPANPYKEWYMPADMEPETKMSLLLNSLVFKIKIKSKETDAADLVYSVTLTGRLQISEMFCRFLYDQKGGIDVSDKNGKQYAWRFYVNRWYGIKTLDPNESLFKNGVKENDIISVQRIIK